MPSSAVRSCLCQLLHWDLQRLQLRRRHRLLQLQSLVRQLRCSPVFTPMLPVAIVALAMRFPRHALRKDCSTSVLRIGQGGQMVKEPVAYHRAETMKVLPHQLSLLLRQPIGEVSQQQTCDGLATRSGRVSVPRPMIATRSSALSLSGSSSSSGRDLRDKNQKADILHPVWHTRRTISKVVWPKAMHPVRMEMQKIHTSREA
mmetsp:Transcript_78359/g.123731  ORF Transcript_78359/g.123731 Transcript_78359/m.123731 type:complete len:202 (-) Transcript_78359:837-1442(-)